MNVERYLRLIAGSVILIAAVLVWKVSPWFLLLIVFVGVNLVESAFTNWCPMMFILRKAGVRDQSASTAAAERAK